MYMYLNIWGRQSEIPRWQIELTYKASKRSFTIFKVKLTRTNIQIQYGYIHSNSSVKSLKKKPNKPMHALKMFWYYQMKYFVTTDDALMH